jgi:hypothetical protein
MRCYLAATRVQDEWRRYTTRLNVVRCQLDALGSSLDALTRRLRVLRIS